METIPSYLRSTLALLERAFPEGVKEEKLPYILRVFYDELSDENLAIVISYFLQLDKGFVKNSIYKCASIDLNNENVVYFKEKLNASGLIEWLDEE